MEAKDIALIQTQWIDLDKIDLNEGQIEGLPANPRTIDPVDYENLKRSIVENPEMLGLKTLLVYPWRGRYVDIDGNQRTKVLRDLGYKQAPCKVIPEGYDLQAIAIKTNTNNGKWDFNALAANWQKDKLETWGVELPDDFGISPDDFGTDFSLKDGEKEPFQQMAFTLADAQAEFIREALKDARKLDEYNYLETFGNTNMNGNALYFIVQQWADARR